MLNKATLIGRAGKDPQVNTTSNNNKVASFSIATSEKYKDKEGNTKETTEWHNVVIWGKLAEIAEKYVKKGSLLYVEGKLTTRSYEKDGVTKYTTEIVVNEMKMLEYKKEGTQSNEPPLPTEPPPTQKTETLPQIEDEDLPF